MPPPWEPDDAVPVVWRNWYDRYLLTKAAEDARKQADLARHVVEEC